MGYYLAKRLFRSHNAWENIGCEVKMGSFGFGYVPLDFSKMTTEQIERERNRIEALAFDQAQDRAASQGRLLPLRDKRLN